MLDTVLGLVSHDLAVDMGTSTTRVHARGRGLVCREPSVIAVREDRGRRQVVAAGTEARAMLGRTPGHIQSVRPVREGNIEDYAAAEDLLRYVFHRALGRRPMVGPRVLLCVPCGTTEVEKRAARKCAEAAGAREVSLVERPLAAALGAELDIAAAEGHMLVDLGGGTTEVSVISLGGVVQGRTVRLGGEHLDQALARAVEERHGLLVGPRSAEELKVRHGSALASGSTGTVLVKGRDTSRGIPRAVEVEEDLLRRALEAPLAEIFQAMVATLERTPPELSSDIVDKGILLVGGGALLRDLDEAIRQRTGLPVVVAEDPLTTAVTGAGRILEQRAVLGGLLV